MLNDRRYFLGRLLVTALAVAAPLLALHAYFLIAQRDADDAAAFASVRARAELVAREADAVIVRAQRILDFLASRPELQTLNGERCASLLKGLTSVDPLLANVGAVDLDGKPLCRAVENAAAYQNYRDVAWFRGAIEFEGPYFSAPYRGEISRRTLVNIVQPLRDPAGKRIGLLAAALDIDALSASVLSSYAMPDGSVVSLVGQDSIIVATNLPYAHWVGQPLAKSVSETASREDPSGFVAVGKDGVERIISFSPLQHFRLQGGAGVPTAAVAAASRSRFVQSLLTIVSVGLLGLLVAVYAARRLSAPLNSLAHSARSFAAGGFETRADEGLPGEFHDVAVEFNRMVESYRQAEEARRAQAAAEAATQAKSQFVANMSHEIRTPINAIMGMTDLALRGELSAQQRGYLANVRLAAGSLLGVINDILDFSKIEAGKLELERVEFRLQDLLDRVIAVVGLRAQQKGLELLMNTAADVPAVLRGDPLRLEQVLVNLCTYAVKFTDDGGVVIVTVKRLAPDVPRVTLSLSVRDTGKGMTPEQVATLFQPFNQLDASTTRRYGGTGLGLAICKQLVTLMGGDISVSSEPGKGSEFVLTVTLEQGTAAPPDALCDAADRGRGHGAARKGGGTAAGPRRAAGAAGGGQRTQRDRRHRAARRRRAHERHGGAHRPRSAAPAGIGAFRCVLMDVQMPEMDGYLATTTIRQQIGAQQLPIIAMTAHAMASDRDKCLAAGMNDYITKPFEPGELFAMLAKWIRADARDPALRDATSTGVHRPESDDGPVK